MVVIGVVVDNIEFAKKVGTALCALKTILRIKGKNSGVLDITFGSNVRVKFFFKVRGEPTIERQFTGWNVDYLILLCEDLTESDKHMATLMLSRADFKDRPIGERLIVLNQIKK